MIRAIVSDLSRVLLFPKDTAYAGSLNALHKARAGDPDYDFFEAFELNQDLLEFYKDLETPVHLFTSDTIQDWPPLKARLDKALGRVFSASKMNLRKDEPASYVGVAAQLGMPPVEVLYVDDDARNVDAAAQARLQTIRYDRNETAIRAIKKALGS